MWRYAPVTESSTFYTYSNNGKSLPECILFGNVYETYNVGDVIDLPLAQETIKCIVSETVREEADYLSLNMSSTKLSASSSLSSILSSIPSIPSSVCSLISISSFVSL